MNIFEDFICFCILMKRHFKAFSQPWYTDTLRLYVILKVTWKIPFLKAKSEKQKAKKEKAKSKKPKSKKPKVKSK